MAWGGWKSVLDSAARELEPRRLHAFEVEIQHAQFFPYFLLYGLIAGDQHGEFA